VKSKISIRDDELLDFYEKNKSSFKEPPKWRTAHIWLKIDDEKDKPKVLKKAKSILNKIAKGESFAKLAKKHSDDELTSDKGGELLWFTEGTIDKKLENHVKLLKKKGEISTIIETNNGIEIFKLLEFKSTRQKDYKEVRESISNTISYEKYQKLYAQLSEDLTDLTYSQSESLQEASDYLNLEIKETELFSKNTKSKTGIIKYPQIIDAVFSEDVYKQMNNSLPIQLENETIVVVRINKKIPSSIKEFFEVKKDIEDLLKEKLGREQTAALGNDILFNLLNSKNISMILKKYSIKWKNATKISLNSDSIDQKIKELAFSSSALNINSNNYNNYNNYKSIILSKGDFVILKLKSVKYPVIADLPESDLSQFKDSIMDNLGNLTSQIYLDILKRKTKIKFTENDS